MLDQKTGSAQDSGADAPAPQLDFAGLYHAMPAAAFVIDTDSGRVVHGNAAAAELSGYPAEHLVGRVAARLFPRCEVSRFWQPSASPPQSDDFIGWIRSRDKRDVAISVHLQRLQVTGHALCMLLAYDITELKLRLDQLTERTRIDPLTGLLNREEFESLYANLNLLRPGVHAGAVLCIGLDDLKRIRDSHGRNQADAVLADFARRVRGAAPAAALLARDGDDGFILVWNDLPPGLLEARRALDLRAETLVRAAQRPYHVGGTELGCTCSIGIALAPHDADQHEILLQCAGLARQHQRQAGHAGYRFFVESDLRRANDEIEVEIALREVIQYDALEQRWLPLIRLRDETCIGVECLLSGGEPLRRHDTGRIVEIAQARGLLPMMGRQGLRRAGQAYERLAQNGRVAALQLICLNLSAQELLAEGFVDDLVSDAANATVPLDRLILEISEPELHRHMDRLREPLRQLDEHRVGIAIDAFGSGFCSMNLLHELPVRLVKIDRRFVWQLEHNAQDREIVRVMIDLAHTLGVQVVAVGVETNAQQRVLRELGCDHAQGYLYSRPLPLHDLVEFLRPHAARSG